MFMQSNILDILENKKIIKESFKHCKKKAYFCVCVSWSVLGLGILQERRVIGWEEEGGRIYRGKPCSIYWNIK